MTAIGLAQSALAITNFEGPGSLSFQLSNPGARALGLGGAFTGLADDATAAYTNPAGLTILRQAEFAFEGRHTSYVTRFSNGGSIEFDPFDDSSLIQSDSSSSVTAPSFASLVYPSERTTFAFYYHRFADFKSEYTAEAIPIADLNDLIFGYSTRLDFIIENVGLSIGHKLTDNISLGFSAVYSDFEIASASVRSGDPVFALQQRQFGGDNDVIFTAGMLWRLNSEWNLGVAWREGGEFSYLARIETLPGNPFHPNSVTERSSFNVPTVISAGLAFRPSDKWLFTFDVNRVRYGDLTDAGVNDLFSPSSDAALTVDDGTEIRLGAEYAFLDMERPFFVRAGIWRDPERRLTIPDSLTQDCVSSDLNFFSCLDATLFRPGDDEMHYSLGVGWAFERFQIDAAADFSELVDTYSVSGVLRF